MEIRVLGSYGARIPGYRTCSFIVNGTLLIDAGTVTPALPLEEQLAISDVLLTHAHLDHMIDLAFLVDNVLPLRSIPITVWAPEPVLKSLREHLFNDKVWPDFTRLPTPEAPALVLAPLPEGEASVVDGVRVRWVEVNHTVFTAGYCLEAGGASVLFSGDTSTTEALWRLGRECAGLKAAFVETSFPNRLNDLAVASRHLTPSLLAAELDKFARPEVPVKIFHMKPQFIDEITADLGELEGWNLQILQGGEEFIF